MTFGEIYDSRYRYMPADSSGTSASARIYPGDAFFLLVTPRTTETVGVKYCVVYETTEKEEKRGERTGVTVSSENPNAYPNNGKYKDGYWYVKRS